jgi:hypothetical protein
LVLFRLLIIACLAWPDAAEPPALKAGPDPRIELLGVVQALAGLRDRRQPWPEGLPAFLEEFKPWRRHQAVTLYRKLFRFSRGRDSLGLILLALSDPPELAWTRSKTELSRDFLDALGGEAKLEAFLAVLRGFAEDSGFARRYARQRAYERMAAAAEAEISGRDFILEVENYVGRPLHARMQFITTGLYTPYLQFNSYIFPYPYPRGDVLVEGPFLVYRLAPPRLGPSRAPSYGLSGFDAYANGHINELFYLLVEPAHKANLAAFGSREKSALPYLEGCMSNWQDCSGQLIVEALATRVIKTRYRRFPADEEGPIGRCVRELESRLQEYEALRASGGKIDLIGFYPRLIAAFDSSDCGGHGG